jgi:hypothetical protein
LPGETGKPVKVICPTWPEEYFLQRGWTGFG